MKDKPLITIATVTYNAERVLDRTLQSVEQQTYPYIEHLIIDGCSSDSTLSYVRRYVERNAMPTHNIRIVCAKDTGLYDAMNKAISLADGAYIVFLNAGDKLHEPITIEQLVACIDWEHRGVNPAILYGETDLVDNQGKFLRHRRLKTPEKLTANSFLMGMLVCHQSFYVRTDIARSYPYDLQYQFSSDYDWCIRIIKHAERRRLRILNSNLILTDYLSEGLTTKNHRKSLQERFKVMSHHYGTTRAVISHLWFVVRAIIKR